ncbi:MAG TPA: hypothetical protein VNY08_09090, partial [Bradyrhizobium sp.]|nr:hypothetical protein [Bradyrhizobium sp.]
VLDDLLGRILRQIAMLSHLRSCERYDEPETLPSSICLICPTSADGGQAGFGGNHACIDDAAEEGAAVARHPRDRKACSCKGAAARSREGAAVDDVAGESRAARVGDVENKNVAGDGRRSNGAAVADGPGNNAAPTFMIAMPFSAAEIEAVLTMLPLNVPLLSATCPMLRPGPLVALIVPLLAMLPENNAAPMAFI